MSNQTPKFGISLEPTLPISRSVDLGILAEKLGFSTIWVPDGGPAPPYSDCIVTLSAIATSTKKIRFGSAILNFYTRNPAWIASDFLALSDLAGSPRNRAILGIGVGADYNVAKFGITNRSGMIDELREAIDSIRELFQGKEVNVRTDAFTIERITLSKSRRNIPIHIGSQSRKGLRLAGEIADGAILTSRIESDLEESMKHISLGIGLGSRKRRDLEITNSLVISVDEKPARAREVAKPTCAYLVAWMEHKKAETHGIDTSVQAKIADLLSRGDEKGAGRLVDRNMLDLLTACGSVEEVTEKCREHLSHGIDQIAFCEPFGPNVEKSFRMIAKKIIPKL